MRFIGSSTYAPPVRRSLALCLVVTLTGSCAEVASECAGTVLQLTAQACVDVLCDDSNNNNNDVDDDDDSDDAPPKPPADIPPPAWHPREGSCDLVRDDEHVRVACPDGTRAVFRAGGDEGPRELIESDAATDADCRGARVVRQGIDLNDDGALDPTEITGRTLECPPDEGVRAPTLVGQLAVHGPEDVMRLSGRRALTGGLVVKAAALLRLELPQLQSLGGTLRIEDAPALETLSLPHLAAVGGDVVVRGASRLRSVSAPDLARVGGSVVMVDNPRLPDKDVQDIVVRLSRHGFAGPVDLGGNSNAAVGDAPPAP